ncbi:YitT family protein [Lapidilactobacillus dextrinicus]|uniref:YitT family protein n=1 Tax=Lapidilactobacillus dextrinicus TaxID=51664 RepID=UPI00070B1152|nr:YitT family protein [Lapidilactobacillus dextrinicus]QFG47652.1 YitT family protein [Lapidilactobacillus dextrinicus]
MRQTESKLLNLLLLIIGIEILAVSINMFYAPHEIAAGGATGIAILLEATLGLNISVVVMLINIVMLILSYIFLGKGTTLRIALGSVLLPICLAITPQIKLIEDPLLTVIVGGAIFAVGISILYQLDASSGGTTVPPLIIKKYFGIKTSTTLLMIDGMICLLNLFVAGIETMFLAILSQILTTIVMNFIETGLDRKKVIYVMSEHDLEELKQQLAYLGKALTIFNVTGGYTGNEREMLMIIVENPDYHHMLKTIRNIDAEAFILVANAAEAHGGVWRDGERYDKLLG